MTSKEPDTWIFSDIVMNNLPALELNNKEDIESLVSKYIDCKEVTGDKH